MGWVRGLLNASGTGAEGKQWRAGLWKELALLSSAKSRGEAGDGRTPAADQLCCSRRLQHRMAAGAAWLQLASSSSEDRLRGDEAITPAKHLGWACIVL